MLHKNDLLPNLNCFPLILRKTILKCRETALTKNLAYLVHLCLHFGRSIKAYNHLNSEIRKNSYQ